MGASDQSTQQMALVHSTQFLDRLQYILTQQAVVVVAESAGTANHATRVTFAAKVLTSPAAAASGAAVALAGSTNVVGTVTGSGNTADSTASDAALLSQVATLWNTLAGVTT